MPSDIDIGRRGVCRWRGDARGGRQRCPRGRCHREREEGWRGEGLAGRVNGGAGIKKGSRTPGRDPWRDGRGECACGGGESASRAHVSRGRGGVYGVQRVRMRGAGDRLAGPRGYGRCYKHDWGVMGHRERDLCGGVHSANEAANDNKNSGLSTGKREGKVGGGESGGKVGKSAGPAGDIHIHVCGEHDMANGVGQDLEWLALGAMEPKREGGERSGERKERRGANDKDSGCTEYI